MREILFRGKRLDNGEWVEGFYNHLPCGRFGADEHMIQTVLENGKIGMLHDIDPCTAGQYTGLKDKNGERIWEGDILSLRTGRPHVVRFKNGAFILEDSSIPISFAIKFEIIGNVHDNPELLKEEAQP